jgi:hypothetical protein
MEMQAGQKSSAATGTNLQKPRLGTRSGDQMKGSARLDKRKWRRIGVLENGRMTIMKDIRPAASGRHGAAADPLGPNSEIGRKLKQYYDDLVSDDVPDRFSQLLAQLEQAEQTHKKD